MAGIAPTSLEESLCISGKVSGEKIRTRRKSRQQAPSAELALVEVKPTSPGCPSEAEFFVLLDVIFLRDPTLERARDGEVRIVVVPRSFET